jgi:glycosyltransferase involved in cell wall biosynthesis
MPAVSVISTVLNEVAEIDALVDSLSGQTLVRTEIIIVDGGSADGTWERLQAAKSRCPGLKPIRDESCSLKGSPGPIARGRNVAIALASSDVIACADAGCAYGPEWLARLTAPLLAGKADYVLGGSWIDPVGRTIWDVASAPFLGISLTADAGTKSCTARSMAFRKEVWKRVGGFPETSFLIDDSGFDLSVRRIYQPTFVKNAKALYRPHHTLKSAVDQVARYGFADGAAGMRRARFFRHLARCVAELAALALLPWTAIPLTCLLLLELYFALRLDWQSLLQTRSPRAVAARLLYSLIVPWVVAWTYITGAIVESNKPNAQNATFQAFSRNSDDQV